MKKYFIIIVVTLVLCSCAQLPRTVYRPWNRTLSENPIPIEIGSKVSVNVKSIETPLLGSDELINNEIGEKVKDLMERRGFFITDANPEYTMSVLYRTFQKTKNTTFTNNENSSDMFAASYVNNYGVLLANTMASTLAGSVSSTTHSVQMEQTVYQHTICIEIFSANGKEVWRYDTLSENGSVDILEVYTPLLQIALSGLPSSHKVIPRVKKLRPDKFADFASMNLLSGNYMCPALPNYISFKGDRHYDSRKSRDSGFELPNVENKEATLAYLDLIETAEYAIPKKENGKWTLDSKIFSEVSLIGRYYLGNDTTPVNVFIELKGTPSSYVIRRARLINDNDYAALTKVYVDWVNSLKNYFNFYVTD